MRKSLSLVEVLIFVSILSTFLVASASIVTIAFQQNTLYINKIKARHHTDQLFEWIKNEKEENWTLFINNIGTDSDNKHCFETHIPEWGVIVPSYTNCQLLDSLYQRYAQFKIVNFAEDQHIEVTIETKWSEFGNMHSTSLHTVLSQWE